MDIYSAMKHYLCFVDIGEFPCKVRVVVRWVKVLCQWKMDMLTIKLQNRNCENWSEDEEHLRSSERWRKPSKAEKGETKN